MVNYLAFCTDSETCCAFLSSVFECTLAHIEQTPAQLLLNISKDSRLTVLNRSAWPMQRHKPNRFLTLFDVCDVVLWPLLWFNSSWAARIRPQIVAFHLNSQHKIVASSHILHLSKMYGHYNTYCTVHSPCKISLQIQPGQNTFCHETGKRKRAAASTEQLWVGSPGASVKSCADWIWVLWIIEVAS